MKLVVRLVSAPRIVFVLALFFVAQFVASGAQVREHDANWIVPPDAAGKLNPLANRLEVELGGRKIFHRRCASCHGEDGSGSPKAPDITDFRVQSQSDGALYWKISGGNAHKGMPTFSFLPELQRWQLVLHIRTLATP